MVKEWKRQVVSKMADRLKSAGTLAIADVGRLPSRHMQEVRRGLRGKAEVKVVKRSLLEKALKEAGLEGMMPHLARKPAVITSGLDAFSLFREVKSLRGRVSAKPGMVADRDVVVRKGGTGLPPGPAIGDLQAAGIPARIEKGQIVVGKETVILKKGDEVTPAVAGALGKLDKKPFELGLDIEAVLQEGTIFPKEVLDVDLDEIRGKLVSAASQAFGLARSTGYPVKEVLESLLAELSAQAKSLALEVDWVSAETLVPVISKANAQADSLKKIGGV